MKKHFLGWAALVLVVALASVAVAQNTTTNATNTNTPGMNASPIAKGKVIFSVQATELSATAVDTISAGDADQPFLFNKNLVGGKATVSYGINEQWALNGSFSWATGYSKTVPPSGTGTEKTSVNAIGVRLGVDRHVNVANWFSIYAGPGFEWTSTGSSITRDTSANNSVTFTNPRASTFSLTGRLGAFVRMSPTFGLYADLGQRLSYTSKTVRGKASELSSGQDGNIGFAVMF